MIHESWYWKRELAKLSGEFKAWSLKFASDRYPERWRDTANFHLERSIFFSALTIRRLIESKKITTKLEEKSIQLNCFKARMTGPTKILHFYGPSEIFEEYDFENIARQNFSPHSLVSEILHSFALAFYVNENRDQMKGIFVCSERNAYRRLIDLPSVTWLELIEAFAADDVTEGRIWWSDKEQLKGHRA
jgi:hypothetical protein